MISLEYEDFSINDSKKENNNIEKIKKNKNLIILFILALIIIISIILILVLTLKMKNNVDETKSPIISVENIPSLKILSFQILNINCSNLNYYTEIQPKDISFNFTTDNSTKIYYSDEINENNVKIKIPSEAKSGNVILNIEKLNFTYEFEIEIVKEFSIKLNENLIKKNGDEMKIGDIISNTRNNFYVIYSFKSPKSGLYDIELSGSSDNDKSYFNVDIDSNKDLLEKRGRNIVNTTQHVISKGWNDYQKTMYGSFYLEENIEYFLKISFLKTEGGFATNLNSIKFLPNENQNKKALDIGYVIYEFDFISKSIYPFKECWAFSPNYIKVENQYVEFYYNQEAYDNNIGVRQYKGAELTGDFTTNKDGWYGYKFYLNDTFPKNSEGTIIAQMFNQGNSNTWAGHIHIINQNLELGYRASSAASAERDFKIGEITWNEWYNFIIYFKVGRNNKGRIKIWLSKDKLKEEEPIFDTGDTNFGFGNWIDDETLDNVISEGNPKPHQIGCKFGLYTCAGGDKVIRFKNFKALEYNPKGAFNIVNPC